MMDQVHIDEKWFYITVENERYIIVEGESIPQRQCKSKRYITKVMFLAAFARPRIDPETGEMWDGKIGIWAFVIKEPAQRSSKNRQRGTLITKCINVTKAVSRDFYKHKLVPAILEKMVRFVLNIKVQQDNAKPHPEPNDQEMNAFFDLILNTSGVNIRLMNQPPNSPDANTLDLAFFRAIQSLQQEFVCKTIDELIAVVETAYWDLPLETCEKVWVTLQMVLNEIVINGGNNGYKLPHMGKDKLMREMGSKIPYRLPCPALLPATAHQSLNGNFVKLWMQQLQAAQALTMLLAPEQPAAEELAVVGEVAVPLLPPVDVDTDGATDDVGEVVAVGSPTGVADEGAAAEFPVREEETTQVGTLTDDTVIEFDEDKVEQEEDGPDPDEVEEVEGVEKPDRVALLMKTFWANLEDTLAWDDNCEQYDHATVEGAVDYLPREAEEEPPMVGRLVEKNHHGRDLVREQPSVTPTATGLVV